MIRLFPGETVLSRFADDAAVLTTHRVCYLQGLADQETYQYILLVNIRRCSTGYRRNILSLLLSMGLAISGLYAGLNSMLLVAVCILSMSAILAAIHFSNSRNLIIIHAANETMEISTKNMNLTGILDCISHIERARSNRNEHLKTRNLVVY